MCVIVSKENGGRHRMRVVENGIVITKIPATTDMLKIEETTVIGSVFVIPMIVKNLPMEKLNKVIDVYQNNNSIDLLISYKSKFMSAIGINKRKFYSTEMEAVEIIELLELFRRGMS